jgi:hypothetical protein
MGRKKSVIRIKYGEDLLIILNMGLKPYQIVNRGTVIFNIDGQCNWTEAYQVNSLE